MYRSSKNGDADGNGMGKWATHKTRSFPTCITIPNLVALYQTVLAYIGGPNKRGYAWTRPLPLGMVRVDPQCMLLPNTCYVHTKFRHSRSNHTSSYGDPPAKFDPLRPAFQGHKIKLSLELTRIDWQPITSCY